MKIAVCVKQVVARDWPLRVDEAGEWVRDADASFEMNEPDAYALEEGLQLKERHGGEVIVCSAGPARVGQVLREGLARGADRAIHVESDELQAAEPSAVGQALAAALRPESCDLVLTGLQSDDQGFGQTGVVLASELGVPHATIIMEITVADGEIRVKRELEGGRFQWVALPLPALLTIQSGINQLRYATLRGIMAARRKPARKVAPETLAPAGQRIVRLYAPEKDKRTRLFEGAPPAAAQQLVRALRDDARVLAARGETPRRTETGQAPG